MGAGGRVARAKGTPMTKGQKRGGLEEQEKHPWCPVEGEGACWGLSSTEHHHGRTSRLQRSGEEVCRGAAPSPETGRVSQGPGWEGMRGHLAAVPTDECECLEGLRGWGGLAGSHRISRPLSHSLSMLERPGRPSHGGRQCNKTDLQGTSHPGGELAAHVSSLSSPPRQHSALRQGLTFSTVPGT